MGKRKAEENYVNGELSGKAQGSSIIIMASKVRNTPCSKGNGRAGQRDGARTAKRTSEGKYRNGLRDGRFWSKGITDSGKRIVESVYSNGKLNGVRREWTWDRVPVEEVTFRNGRTFGPFVIYHSNGKVSSKGNYLSGLVRDGKYVSYYNNGRIYGEGKYKKGVEVGEWRYYTREGKRMEGP